ncbi:MAG: hypothetical protein HOE90_03165 [Bacteriovoracaceae bacterium]|nr:hypothetical protein [Bacteriovoracaceae bacterium]
MKYILVICATLFMSYAFSSELTVMSYNVENLFDTIHDAGKSDWEYLPAGHKKKIENCNLNDVEYYKKKCLETDWTSIKLQAKLMGIKKVVTDDGKVELPDFLGLSEVENENVVSQLSKTLGYSNYLITNSPDKRGIDVALLYNEGKDVKLLASDEYVLKGKVFASKPTRNILAARFEIFGDQVINIYVNHWPSQANPAKARMKAAKRLRKAIKRRRRSHSKEYFLALGDFNVIDSDYPHPLKKELEKSMVDVKSLWDEMDGISFEQRIAMPMGSYFYGRNMEWNHLDHIFIGKRLVSGSALTADINSFQIVKRSFSTGSYTYTKDGSAHKGTIITGVPKRFNHRADKDDEQGFSDHFPLVITLKMK